MELRQLRYFVAVAEHGHVTRAAQLLHVAQPTVSQGLRQLERELGVRLFERSGRGVALTEAGERLLTDAWAALRHVQRLGDLALLLDRGDTGLLRVGYLPMLNDGIVLRAAQLLRARRPGTEIAMREVGFGSRLTALRRADVDLTLFSPPIDEPDMVAGPVVHRGRRLLAVPRSHRLAGRGPLAVEDLAGETLPSVEPHPTPLWAEAWLPARTPSGRRIHRGPVVRTVGESLVGVAAGRFLAILPGEIAQVYGRGDIMFRPMDMEPYEIVPVWRSDGGSALIDAFVESLREAGDAG